MMNGDLEAQGAQEIRELARQYCDGAFNKGEYRRRRRDVLLRCVQNDFSASPEEQQDDQDDGVTFLATTPKEPRDWLPFAMIAVTLTVLVIMGFLIYTIA